MTSARPELAKRRPHPSATDNPNLHRSIQASFVVSVFCTRQHHLAPIAPPRDRPVKAQVNSHRKVRASRTWPLFEAAEERSGSSLWRSPEAKSMAESFLLLALRFR